jgi:hypothetical protein
MVIAIIIGGLSACRNGAIVINDDKSTPGDTLS